MRTKPSPTSPFVGLTPYSEADAPYFFGRERERTLIIANLMASRLTLLYGASGVGKSSVLRAGVLPHFNKLMAEEKARSGHVSHAVAMYSSWSEDPVTGLLEAAHKSLTSSQEERHIDPPGRNLSLAASLKELTRPKGQERTATLSLLIVLDQFEEFFLYPQKPHERSFADQLPEALNQPDLRVNFLISLREDYMASLDRFKGHIPYLFDNSLRIKHLSKTAARNAIENPIAAYNEIYRKANPVKIETELIDAVLDQVTINKVTLGDEGEEPAYAKAAHVATAPMIETPYLQLVMTRLWQQEMALGSSLLRMATLKKLAGARTIVRTHVDGVMKRFSLAQQGNAALMFRHLVTPSGTKIALFPSDLAALTDRTEADLTDTLKDLAGTDAGILTIVDPPPDRPDEPRYEIRHDALAPAILNWRDRFVQTQKSVQDLDNLISERSRVRRLRLGLIAVLSLLVVMVFLAGYAYYLRGQALSLQLASQSLVEGVDPEVRLLLANAAMEAKHTEPAEYALRASLLRTNLRIVLKGHGNWVNRASFSPDGRLIATASGDNTARIWDLATQKSVELKGHTGPVRDVSFSQDGQQVVTASNDFTARVWDVRSGEVRRTLAPHGATVLKSSYSPNGERIVTACEDGHVRVWEASNGSLIHDMAEPEVGADKMYDAQFSPNGFLIVTASRDDHARVWDAQTGKLKHKLRHGSLVYTAKFSADSKRIVSASQDGTARIWDAQTGNQLAQLPQQVTNSDWNVYDASFSPDGSFVATAGKEDKARIWDWSGPIGPSRPIILNLESGKTQGAHRASFSPSGDYVVTADEDGTAKVWAVQSGRPTAVLKGHTAPIRTAEFSPDGRFIITASQDGTARVWKSSVVPDVDQVDVRQDRENKGRITYSPDGRYVYLTGESGGLEWDTFTRTGTPIQIDRAYKRNSFSPGGEYILGSNWGGVALWQKSNTGWIKVGESVNSSKPSVAVLSPNNKYVAIGEDGGRAKLWEIIREQPITLKGHDTDSLVSSVAFSPDSQRVTTGSGDRTARIWDCKTGNLVAVLRGHTGKLTGVTYSPDGKYIVTSSEDSSLRVWNAQSGAPMTEIEGHTGAITRIVFSGDSRFVVSTSVDATARVWEVPSGRGLAVLTGHVGPVRSAAFSPDGRVIVTAGEDRVARAWEWRTEIGQMWPAVLTGHEGEIDDVAFSPDGQFLTTISTDGTARIYAWEKFAPVNDLLGLVNLRVTRGLSAEEKDKYYP